MTRKFLTETIFWIHFVIFGVWVALFFVPSSVWPKRIIFHFWYVLIIILSELITGLILMKQIHKFRIICPLTTIMQTLHGYGLDNPKNYDHSFIREFAERLNIRIPYGFIGFLIFLSLGIIIFQYILF